MAKKAKPPAGNTARMTRRQPRGSMPGRRSTDPKACYTKEQLAEIGAIAIVWNHIDDFVDWLLHICLGSPISLMWAVGRSIGSVDAKLDLLTSRIMDNDARACIEVSFTAIKEYKRYRDRIVHSVPYNVELGIAHSMDRKANIHQSLVTIEALSALYERMKLLLDELPEIDLLFRLSKEEDAQKVYQANTTDPVARRRDHDVPLQTARCRERQNVRVSLPSLPFFPDE